MNNSNMGKELLEGLAAPFNLDEIEWRVQSASQKDGLVKLLVTPYIEARAVMNRFDSVCGANWQSHYDQIVVNGKEAFQCRLSVKINDEWITRTDAAEISEFESVKGGHSNALKRAAVQWGAGRYLYDCPQFWVELKPRGKHRVYGNFKINGQSRKLEGYYDTPNLPKWALSEEDCKGKPQPSANTNQGSTVNGNIKNKDDGNSDHKQVLTHVKGALNALNVPLKFIPGLLNRLDYVGELENAPIATLKKLYKVLFPVYVYVKECKKFELTDRQILDYAQITLGISLENHLNLIFKMDKNLAQKTLELVKGDFQVAS